MDESLYFNFEIGNMNIKASVGSPLTVGNRLEPRIHNHTNFEYHFVLRESVELFIESTKISLGTEEALLIFPDTYHHFVPTNEDAAVFSFYFTVVPNKRRAAADYYGALSRALPENTKYLFIDKQAPILDCVKQIQANLSAEKPFAKELVCAYFQLFFYLLFGTLFEKETLPGSAAEKPERYFSRRYMIEDYFNEHYMEDITLKKLAGILCLSEKQTERIIQNIFHMNFREKLTATRLEIAKSLLSKTDKQVEEVAALVGYRSYNGFYNWFKANTGCSPQEFRKINQ